MVNKNNEESANQDNNKRKGENLGCSSLQQEAQPEDQEVARYLPDSEDKSRSEDKKRGDKRLVDKAAAFKQTCGADKLTDSLDVGQTAHCANSAQTSAGFSVNDELVASNKRPRKSTCDIDERKKNNDDKGSSNSTLTRGENVYNEKEKEKQEKDEEDAVFGEERSLADMPAPSAYTKKDIITPTQAMPESTCSTSTTLGAEKNEVYKKRTMSSAFVDAVVASSSEKRPSEQEEGESKNNGGLKKRESDGISIGKREDKKPQDVEIKITKKEGPILGIGGAPRPLVDNEIIRSSAEKLNDVEAVVGEDGKIKEEGSAAGAEREQDHGMEEPALFSPDSSSRDWSSASPSSIEEREDFGDTCLRVDAGKMPSRESSSGEEPDRSLAGEESDRSLVGEEDDYSLPEDVPPKIFSSLDIDGVVEKIKECSKIIVMVGAGLSTAAGIPDFRTPGTGLYDNLQKYDLPNPEALFTLEYFRNHPAPFYDLCRELWPDPNKYKPTLAHYFLALLEDKGKLLRCYSQNIDCLEELAGLSPNALVAAHGNFSHCHGIDSKRPIPTEEVRKAVMSGNWKSLLTTYKELVKPDIVFFNEDLPERYYELSEEDFPMCDLLLVMGTSLTVFPFNKLISSAPIDCPRVLVNRDKVGTDDETWSYPFHFDDPATVCRDVFLGGDLNEQARELCKKLDWMEKLEALMNPNKGAPKDVAPKEAAKDIVPKEEATDVVPLEDVAPKASLGEGEEVKAQTNE